MQNLRFALLATSLAFTTALAGCTTDEGSGPDATLEISNESDYVIEEIYLTDVGNASWGANQLGGDVLFPDESFVFAVDCGTYDALLVDEDGVECELNNLNLCLNDATWVIRNNTCNVFARTQSQEAPKAAQPTAAAK